VQSIIDRLASAIGQAHAVIAFIAGAGAGPFAALQAPRQQFERGPVRDAGMPPPVKLLCAP